MPIPREWDLSGKSAVITADRRGWTPYLAAALAEAGADVAIAGSEGSDMGDAMAAVKDQGRRAVAIPTDVTDSASVEAMVEGAISMFGKLDILVNNARAEFGKRFEDVTEAEWRTIMDFNVKSVFLCCRAVGKKMLERWRSNGPGAASVSTPSAPGGLRLTSPPPRTRRSYWCDTCPLAERVIPTTWRACWSIWPRTRAISSLARLYSSMAARWPTPDGDGGRPR